MGYCAIGHQEVEIVIPHLIPGALILIDDTYQQGVRWHGERLAVV